MRSIETARLALSFLVLATLTLACTGHGSGCPADDGAMGRKLLEGTQEEGDELRACAESVLEDVLSAEYRFSRDTRVSAFEYIRTKRIESLSPTLVEVALLDPAHSEEWKTTLDWIAVRQALITLRDFRHAEATRLSERRLAEDTWIRPTAIRNLRLLGHWDSTRRIAEILCDVPLDAESDADLSAAAGFLRESPVTIEAACSCARDAADEISRRDAKSVLARSALEDLGALVSERCSG